MLFQIDLNCINNIKEIIGKIVGFSLPIIIIILYFKIQNKYQYRCTSCKKTFKISELKREGKIFIGTVKTNCPYCSKFTTIETVKKQHNIEKS